MPPSPDRLARFSRAERWCHRSIAVLVLILFATAAALYLPAVSAVVGNRPVMRLVHLAAGYVLPVPVLLALASAAFRVDMHRLNRFTDADRRWLSSREARSGRAGIGKFNAGQKLNSAFTLGFIIVMVGTGLILAWNAWFPDDIRTGATFTHDWLALLGAIVISGHIAMALRDPIARAGMRTGEVPSDWAEREHPAWAAEVGVSEPRSHPAP